MNYFVIYSSFILLNIRLLFHSSNIFYELTHLIIFMVFWVVILGNYRATLRFLSPTAMVGDRSLKLLLYLFLLMICVGYFRALLNGLISLSQILSAFFRLITISLLLGCVFEIAAIRGDLGILRKGIFVALNSYVVLVVLLYFVGLRNPNENLILDPPGTARILELFGIYIERIRFPMAPGVNVFGHLCGCTALVNAVLIIRGGHSKRCLKFAVVGLVFSLFALIFADSRGAISYLFSSILLIMLLPRRHILKLRLIPVLALCGPILLSVIEDLLPQEFILSLSRGGSGALSPHRAIIWENVLYIFSDFSFIHLVGYGMWGQVPSGIIDRYFNDIFSQASFEEKLLSSNVHSFVLQQLVDFGYIGLCFSVYFFYRILESLLRNYLKSSDIAYLVHAYLFLYLIFLGFSEAVPTIAILDLFSIFLYICIWAVVMGGRTGASYALRVRTKSSILQADHLNGS